MPIREQFPEAGSSYLDGESDGWEYRTIFSGSSLALSYDMVKKFLQEEGYEDVPLPKTVEELLLFKHPRVNGQITLFAEQGYIHNPIKILFHPYRNRSKTLILCLYNEAHEDHLLRFHGVLP
jgi:hypothetical protein